MKVSTTPTPDGMMREMGKGKKREIKRLGKGVGKGR